MVCSFEKIFTSFKSINHRLFFALLLTGLIPTIYTTVRIFFLGQMPDDYGFSIAAQMQWVQVIYEIVQEAFILPLYFFIGKAFADRQKFSADNTLSSVEKEQKTSGLTNMVRSGLLIVFFVYTILSVFIIIFANPLVRFMGQDLAALTETVNYIRLETIANIFLTLVRFILVVLITIKKEKYLYFVLGLQMVLVILCDICLISMLPVSAQMGVNGIAVTNILVNAFLLVLTLFILYRENIRVFTRERLSFKWVNTWARVGGISGLESFVRNIFFMLMIVRMVNIVGEQGTFWVANSFIWGWLLLPVLQLGELIKRDCGEQRHEAIRQKTLGYFMLTTIFVTIWFITLPLWQPFLQIVLQLENYQEVFFIALISVGFYVMFAYNNVLDSIFYGLGKTKYMLYQSLIVNILFYGCVFILYVTGIYVPTLTLIALMFAAGIAFDSIVTYYIFTRMLKKEKISIW